MKPYQTIENNIREPIEGYEVLIVSDDISGRGRTVNEAFNRVYQKGLRAKHSWTAYHINCTAIYTDSGFCSHAIETPPVMVAKKSRINRSVFIEVF